MDNVLSLQLLGTDLNAVGACVSNVSCDSNTSCLSQTSTPIKETANLW